MSEQNHQITRVVLRVVADPGHNGPLSEYRIDPDPAGYTVTLRISRIVPGLERNPVPPPIASPRWPRSRQAAEGNQLRTSSITETLAKAPQQVETFLQKLVTELHVYELTDLKWSYPFLHPIFYTFSCQDSDGQSHGFEYQIEGSNHLDERYQRLIAEFNSFFESERVFKRFFESQR